MKLISVALMGLACLCLAAPAAMQQAPAQAGVPQNPSPMVEHTRAHLRLPKESPPGRHETLSLGTLFIPAALQSKSHAPVMFFFHAKGAVPEIAGARNHMVVVSAVLGAGSRVYAQPFLDTGFFGKLLGEAETRSGMELGPITLAGWSAGCGAIRQIMSTPEYYDRVANTIMIDGIHTSYVGGKPGPLESQIDPKPLDVFIKMARDAIAGKKRVVITHSEIFPGTFASTTETSDYILNALGLHPRPVVKWGPMGTQELEEVRSGKFLMLGFAGNSAPDHVDELHSLPGYLKWLN